ncbi:MAG: aminotransferase class III-fold pyridoxal phosphate-dependent enzyme [Candidatus Liptonbacteria bacterium]|nr:aminotransferase class III-fold pyridoxal phosphate-dependent enzyme [Candidatus Liptonbacteria bacterium]
MRWIKEAEEMSRDDVLDARKYFITTTDMGSDLVPEWAEGARVYDMSGKLSIDFSCGFGSLNTGHNHPKVLNSIRYVMDHKLGNLPSHQWKNKVVTKLAEKLCQITPGDFPKKVFLGRGGAEVVKRAINLCRNRMNADQILLACYGAFHGRGGALELHHSKELHRKKFIKDSERSYPIEFPQIGHDCVRYQSALLSCHAWWRRQKPGAFFFECVQGEGGVNVACHYCLPLLVHELREAKVIIVADEIQTFGKRTGKMFACEWYGIEPDIIILAKSLCPGGNLSAYVAKADLDYENKARDSLTGVFVRDCAASLGAIEALEDVDTDELFNKIDLLYKVAPKGLGLMRRISFPDAVARDNAIQKCRQSSPVGLIISGAGENFMRVYPPVTITEGELLLGLNILKEVLQS